MEVRQTKSFVLEHFQLVCALCSCFTAFQNVYLYTSLTGYLDTHGGPSSNLVSSPHQWTPLHHAARGGHVGAVELLLQAGADVNIKDNVGVSEYDYSTNCGLLHQR